MKAPGYTSTIDGQLTSLRNDLDAKNGELANAKEILLQLNLIWKLLVKV